MDVSNRQALIDAVGRLSIDAVLHLAAQSNVPAAFADPRGTFDVNLVGTLNLLEALRAAGFRGRFLYVGSGDVYGLVPEAGCRSGRSPARAAQSLCGQQGRRRGAVLPVEQDERGVDLIARPFNHIGPGQSEHFVVSGFARQVAEIKQGRRARRSSRSATST